MRYITNGLATCALLACSASVMAAPITWGAAQNTVNAFDVATTGALVEAFNATNTSTGSVTVNGVEFQNTASLLGNSFGGALAGEASGDVSYDSLLNTFNFGGGASTSITIADGLLSSGSPYLIQVWYTDLRELNANCCRNRVMSFAGGPGDAVGLNASGGGLGQFAIGEFTAIAASQTLSLAANGFQNAHISGYQIRSIDDVPVPEPATLLLMGSGLAGLGFGLTAFRRRKA